MTTQIAIDTTQRMYVTSCASLAPPLRTLMSAPKPTNTPAISGQRKEQLGVLHVPPPPALSWPGRQDGRDVVVRRREADEAPRSPGRGGQPRHRRRPRQDGRASGLTQSPGAAASRRAPGARARAEQDQHDDREVERRLSSGSQAQHDDDHATTIAMPKSAPDSRMPANSAVAARARRRPLPCTRASGR